MWACIGQERLTTKSLSGPNAPYTYLWLMQVTKGAMFISGELIKQLSHVFYRGATREGESEEMRYDPYNHVAWYDFKKNSYRPLVKDERALLRFFKSSWKYHRPSW